LTGKLAENDLALLGVAPWYGLKLKIVG